MIMHSAEFSATLIVRKPLFDQMALSAKCCEQTLVLLGAKSGLSRKPEVSSGCGEGRLQPQMRRQARSCQFFVSNLTQKNSIELPV